MSDFEEIEERLFKVLKTNKVKEVANILGVREGTYSNWRARKKIPYEEIISICEINKFDMRYIFHGEKVEMKAPEIKYREEIHKMIDDLDDKKLEIYYYLIKAERLKENL